MKTQLHRNVQWTSDSNLKRQLGNLRDVIKRGSSAETGAKNTSRKSTDWFFHSTMSRKQRVKLLAEHSEWAGTPQNATPSCYISVSGSSPQRAS